MNGLFISFEGIDGVGKTTQVEKLCQFLESRGRQVVVTREPGGTGLGVMLRDILLHGSEIAPKAEALLFAADRAQHVEESILPALRSGAVVICDRFIDSSLAYQAAGRELSQREIRDINMWACGGILPQRTYLLDMDPETSHARLEHREDRMESAGKNFQRRTRDSFLTLADAEPQRFLVIDASCDKETVWAGIKNDIEQLLIGNESRSVSGKQPGCDAGVR